MTQLYMTWNIYLFLQHIRQEEANAGNVLDHRLPNDEDLRQQDESPGKGKDDLRCRGHARHLRGQDQSVRDNTWQQAEEEARPGHEGGRRDDGQAHTVLRPGRVGGLRRQGGGGPGNPETRHKEEHGRKVVFNTKVVELK